MFATVALILCLTFPLCAGVVSGVDDKSGGSGIMELSIGSLIMGGRVFSLCDCDEGSVLARFEYPSD